MAHASSHAHSRADDLGDAAGDAKRNIEQHAQDAMTAASPWVEFLARAGYAAKGVVYSLVGFIAARTAFGNGGDAKGSKDALASLLGEPFGRVLLGVVAAGLAGYALWCFVRAVWDPEHDGKDAKGVAKRAFSFARGLVYVSLVVAVIGMIRGAASSGGGDATREWTAWLMSFPLGVWLVGLAGASVIAYGAAQAYRAWKVKLDKQLSLGRMSPAARRWTVYLSRFGMAARGVVFGIIGTFLIQAALHANPREAKGLGGALESLRSQSYGPWLLAAVALGLIAYGLYQFARARYRRIDPA